MKIDKSEFLDDVGEMLTSSKFEAVRHFWDHLFARIAGKINRRPYSSSYEAGLIYDNKMWGFKVYKKDGDGKADLGKPIYQMHAEIHMDGGRYSKIFLYAPRKDDPFPYIGIGGSTQFETLAVIPFDWPAPNDEVTDKIYESLSRKLPGIFAPDRPTSSAGAKPGLPEVKP